MKKRDWLTVWPVSIMAGCLTLVCVPQASAENALKPDLQHALLVSLLAALPAAKAATDTPMDLSVSVGYREDNLDWNIAGGGVNVLSELSWKNLAIAQVQATAKLNIKNDWRVRADLGYGAIMAGTNQDSDYNGNNRTLEFSRSNNKAGGDVRDASIGIGKTLRLLDQTVGKFIYITPSIGLSVHQQNLTMTEGMQTVSRPDLAPPGTGAAPLGSFAGLASSYAAQWQGPWAGIEALIETGSNLSLTASAEYHVADYSAKANWNLRNDFAHPVSFKHTAKGQGIVGSVGASYPVARNWTMNLTLKYHQWSTRAGSDVVYFSNGSVGYTRLNTVIWESTAYNLEIVHSF